MWAAITSTLSWNLKQQKTCHLRVRRLEVQDPCVSKVGFWRSWGQDLCGGLPARLLNHHLCRYLHTIFPLSVFISQFPLLVRTPARSVSTNWRSTTHFNLIPSLETRPPNMVTFWGTGVKELNTGARAVHDLALNSERMAKCLHKKPGSDKCVGKGKLPEEGKRRSGGWEWGKGLVLEECVCAGFCCLFSY